MKSVPWGLLLAALAAAGCDDANLLRPTPLAPPKSQPSQAAPAPRPLPAVTADQVTPNNAGAKADQLWDELDRDVSRCPAGADCPSCTCGHK